jgi:hypothetical protein
MKRSGWVTGFVVMQAVWTLALIALPVYLLFLARSPAILNGADGKDAAYGLKIGAAVVAVPALSAIVLSYGLWKEKLWGWWLGLLSNLFHFGRTHLQHGGRKHNRLGNVWIDDNLSRSPDTLVAPGCEKVLLARD